MAVHSKDGSGSPQGCGGILGETIVAKAQSKLHGSDVKDLDAGDQ